MAKMAQSRWNEYNFDTLNAMSMEWFKDTNFEMKMLAPRLTSHLFFCKALWFSNTII